MRSNKRRDWLHARQVTPLALEYYFLEYISWMFAIFLSSHEILLLQMMAHSNRCFVPYPPAKHPTIWMVPGRISRRNFKICIESSLLPNTNLSGQTIHLLSLHPRQFHSRLILISSTNQIDWSNQNLMNINTKKTKEILLGSIQLNRH